MTDVGAPGADNFWSEVRPDLAPDSQLNGVTEGTGGDNRVGKRLILTGIRLTVNWDKAENVLGPERVRFLLVKERTRDGKHLTGGNADTPSVCDFPASATTGVRGLDACHQTTAGKKMQIIKEWQWFIPVNTVGKVEKYKVIKLALNSMQLYSSTTAISDTKNRYSLWYIQDAAFQADNRLTVTWCTFFSDQLA